jgi:hypothetical protein
MPRRIVWFAIWIVSILATAQYVAAQREPLRPTTAVMTNPITVSGSDIGFRVQGYGPDGAVGRLVVRVNGQWMTASEVHK